MSNIQNENINSNKNNLFKFIPGFRTNKRWKKIIGVLGYIFMIIILLVLIFSNQKYCENTKDIILDKILSFIMFLLFVLVPFIIFTDLLGIRKKINFFKNKPILFRVILIPTVMLCSLVVALISFAIIDSQHSDEYVLNKKIYEQKQLASKYESILQSDLLCDEMNNNQISTVKNLLKDWDKLDDDFKNLYVDRKDTLQESLNQYNQKLEQQLAEKKAKEKADKEAKQKAKEESEAEKETEQKAKEAEAEKEKSDTTNNYKYSGDKLSTLIDDYMSKSKDSYKEKIKQASPDETYELILNKLKDYNDKDSSEYVLSSSIRLNKYKQLSGLYSDCFTDDSNNSKINEIFTLENDIVNLEKQLKDFNSVESEFKKSQSVVVKDFFISSVLNTKYDDTISGSIQKELDSLNKDGNKTQYVATNVKYDSLLGSLPGNENYIVEPIGKFSESGICTLTVIQDGTKSVIDSQGFEKEIPLYKEVGDNYKSDIYNKYNKLINFQNDMKSKESQLEDLLSLN